MVPGEIPDSRGSRSRDEGSRMERSDRGSTPPESQADVRRIESTALFSGGSKVIIEHDGSIYLLRITRLGKLILTK